jgi:predicted GNAT family N-acyltransferase
VFCDEQGVSLQAERDGRDDEALHVVALDRGQVVGTCRLLVADGVARLGRMAVEPSLRGRGAGLAVLREAEHAAKRAGAGKVRLHAQTAALALYERAGYEALGAPFLEEDIEHVTMERRLDA